MEALWIWRQFPGQIASDLSQFHHRRIAEWHRGEMSSFELLELCEWMDDGGRLKEALRGGRWTLQQIIEAETFNELARLRASYHAVNGGKNGAYEPFAFEDPAVAEAREQESSAAAKWRSNVQDEMFASWGWSDQSEEG